MTVAFQANDSPGTSDRDGFWAAVLEVLSEDPSISRASFASWLQGTRLVRRRGNVFVVAARHGFAREKLERTFREHVVRALRAQTGDHTADVEFTAPGSTKGHLPGRGGVAAESAAQPSGQANEPREAAPLPLPLPLPLPPPLPAVVPGAAGPDETPARREHSPRAAGRPSALNPRLTFAAFVVVKENQFAHAACRAVADNPVLSHNPLFLYGAAGTGKTHLLHAIGHHVLAARPGVVVDYLTAPELTRQLTREASRGERAAVVAAHAAADVFLLDDVQHLAGSPAHKEVLHLVDALLAADRQLVCAADRPLRAIPGLDERLRARLTMGLVADLAPLEAESRLAVLRARAPRGEALPRRRATPQQVLRAVAAAFGVPPPALLEKRRDREVVLPRQVAMYLMRRETGASLSEIGAALGGRDHTTVMHGCEKIAAALARDAHLQEYVEAARLLLADAAAGAAAAAAAH